MLLAFNSLPKAPSLRGLFAQTMYLSAFQTNDCLSMNYHLLHPQIYPRTLFHAIFICFYLKLSSVLLVFILTSAYVDFCLMNLIFKVFDKGLIYMQINLETLDFLLVSL